MITNPDYSRLTQLIKLLEEVSILEYEKLVAKTTPINRTTLCLIEHRLVYLKEQLKGYKYYEVECAELLLSDIVNTSKLYNKVNAIRNRQVSTNNVKKALNKPIESKEGLDLFFVMLIGFIQDNKNRFDNTAGMNILIAYIVSVIEEDNLGRKNNYGY